MRGFVGTKSGLGIFTKVAIKLYPYPCDTKWEMSGVMPNYEFKIPNYIQYHVITYKTLKQMEEGMTKIEAEQISFMCFHTPNNGVATVFSFSVEDLIKRYGSLMKYKNPIIVVIAGRTKREFNYKEKVLASVVEDTGGKDIVLKGKLKIPTLSYADGIRCNLGFHGFLISGAFQSTLGGMDALSMCRNMLQLNGPLRRQFIAKKVIADDNGDGAWITSYEHGHSTIVKYRQCMIRPTWNLLSDITNIMKNVINLH